MHDLGPVEPDRRVPQPERRVAELHREGRQRLQVLLIDEGELVLVGRILPEADAERVKDAILRSVGLLDRRDFERAQFFVVEGHRMDRLVRAANFLTTTRGHVASIRARP